MSFKLSASVEVTEWKNKFDQKKDKAIARLLHLYQPYINPSAKDAASLADAYVLEVASIYGINAAWLARLRDKALDKASDSGPQMLRVNEKVMMETHVVSYALTHFGLPIWEAGLTALVQSNPLRVTSSCQTVHADVTGVPQPNALSPFAPTNGQTTTWVKVLGLTASQAEQFRVNRMQLLIYRFDLEQRVQTDTEASEHTPAHHRICLPTLPLPTLPNAVESGRHYIVTELLFTLPLEKWGSLNWRAFVEVETGAVLYLRAFVACARGMVFETDPMTASGGTTPASSSAVLNQMRTIMPLEELRPPNGAGPWTLTGKYVRIENVSPPPVVLPTSVTGDFFYDAKSDDFAAVNAYYHCDALFRLMESMGFNMSTYFDGAMANPGFPIPVDHRALNDGMAAFASGNTTSDGCKEFIFGRADLSRSIGIATDPRMIAHEFCHALLLDSVHWPQFGFAHSAGDALAAILHDPGSKAPDRGLNFPWLPDWSWRRHDRPVGVQYVWGGTKDHGEYSREDILTTTLFRIYSVIGGDLKTSLAVQKAAARKVVYLIIRGIGSLSPTTPTPIPDFFKDALIAADAHSPMFDKVPGGTIHKIIGWSFEIQGLGPPLVDVFIDDGRKGEYAPYLEDFSNTTHIWNRLSPAPSTGPTDHQTPVLGVPNYLFVQIQNRGTQLAKNVAVRAYRRKAVATMNWPGDWQPLTTPLVAVPGGGVPSGGNVVVGPFAWTPVGGNEYVLASVSAEDDRSNADSTDPASRLPCALGPTPIDQLVPFDNNIAMRRMAVNQPIAPA